MSEQLIRRRIDRVTADDYLDDISEASAATLRLMRDECRDEEGRISYARRLLHGQLDLVHAEIKQRIKDHKAGGSEQAQQEHQDLLESIAEALFEDEAKPGAERSQAHREFLYNPDLNRGRRRGDTLLDDVPLGRIREMPADELAELVDKITNESYWVNDVRHRILKNLDTLQEELVKRYRSGATNVTEIV